uniref:Reverse transcriptase domain-containing protein n=1 Tax=Tanacetum cinerariifolium TaxID=118510 RepID=A0A6L2JG25_TANCI|nr:reverse transcriptase domain-containing protein [Tanacetum cinerariifolium]
MRTRSQSCNNFPQQEASPAIVEPLRIELPFLEDQFQEDPPVDPSEVLMAGEIAPSTHRGLRGRNQDPHAHIRYFNKITSTMRVPNVPSSSIKLMLFPFSLEGLEKEAPRSILTSDDLVTKFINQFFPPSKTTNLRNDITRFQQRFDELFYEAWDRFNDLLRACPHHGFSELHQLDTFYNALNINDQDSLNSAAGTSSSTPAISSEVSELKDLVRALLLDKKNQSSAPAQSSTLAPVKAIKPNCVTCCGAHSYQNFVAKASTSSSTPAVSSEVFKLKDIVRALLLDKKNQSSAPASSSTLVKAVEPNCVTCGGTYSYQNCPATSGNVYRDNIQEYVSQAAAANYNQGNTGFRPQMVANQIRPPGFPPHQNNQNIFNRGDNFNQNRGGNFNQGGSGTLPGNTITNPKEELKGITTRSGVAYQGPIIPTSSKVMKQGTEVTKDQVQTLSSQSTTPVQPPVVQSKTQTPVSEPVSMHNLKPYIPYPLRRDNERCRDQANEQIEKLYKIFKDMSFEISFTDSLILMPKFASTLKALIGNKEKLSEMARTLMNEHCSAVILNKLARKLGDPDKFLIPCEFPRMDECLALANLGVSINLMPLSVWEALLLLQLTLTCMTLELADRLVSKPIGIAKDVSVKVDVFYFPADFLVVDFEPDLRVPLILERCFLKTGRALIDVQKGELTLRIRNEAITYNLDQTVELKDLPPHLEYAFLEGNNKFPIIIAKELGDEEKSALIKVLKSHKRAIAWKLSDIQGINPEFCTHKILMEEDYKPASMGQPVHCVPKKGGFTVVENEENELIATRLVTGWRVCIDYRKLNEATRKDHFPLPFMDQMLERLAGNEYYCFLDGFSGYFQIPIHPHDQEKTTFTCPYETFAYRRMPFGLCNAPGTFQRCMLAIFHDMVEKTMEIFMDNFSVFGNSFENDLSRLDKMLQRCEDTKLCLNWEKSHFMVKEGIVLGHKISKNGIEVDKAKIDVITKLPHHITVKGVRSFLGHAGFYR